MKVEEIKAAINALSEKERCELRAWLQNYSADEWDKQMESDALAGRFERLVRESEEDFLRGECRSFP